MKKHFLLLISAALIVSTSYNLYTSHNKQSLQGSVTKEPTDEAQWLETARNLKDPQKDRLISFLQATCNTLPKMMDSDDTEARKKIEKVLGKAIAHTEQELQKIEAFLHLVETMSDKDEDEEAFDIRTLVETSTPSQGQNRTNTSTALRDILIQNASLLDIQSIVNDAIKKVNLSGVKEALQEEKTVFTLIKQAYSSATAILETDSVKLYCDLLHKLQDPKEKSSEKSEKSEKKSS